MHVGRRSNSTRRVRLLARNLDHVSPRRLDLSRCAYVRPCIDPTVSVLNDLASETGCHETIKCVLRFLHRARLRTLQHYEPTTSHDRHHSHHHEHQQPQCESDRQHVQSIHVVDTRHTIRMLAPARRCKTRSDGWRRSAVRCSRVRVRGRPVAGPACTNAPCRAKRLATEAP